VRLGATGRAAFSAHHFSTHTVSTGVATAARTPDGGGGADRATIRAT
jgi:hypothetical protein